MPDYRIEYRKRVTYQPGDVPGIDDAVTYDKGQAFDVASVADAEKYHPGATIVGPIEAGGVVGKYSAPRGDAPAKRDTADKAAAVETVQADSTSAPDADASSAKGRKA